MLRAAFIGLIRFYRMAISPWMSPVCRFTPSCSTYAIEAVGRHGAVRGGSLAVRRLLRCRPWGGSGYDPVPMLGPGGTRSIGSGASGGTRDVGVERRNEDRAALRRRDHPDGRRAGRNQPDLPSGAPAGRCRTGHRERAQRDPAGDP